MSSAKPFTVPITGVKLAPLVTKADKVSRNILTAINPGSRVTVSRSTVAGKDKNLTMAFSFKMPAVVKPYNISGSSTLKNLLTPLT